MLLSYFRFLLFFFLVFFAFFFFSYKFVFLQKKKLNSWESVWKQRQLFVYIYICIFIIMYMKKNLPTLGAFLRRRRQLGVLVTAGRKKK